MLLQKKASCEVTLGAMQTKMTLVRWAWPEQKLLLMARDGQRQHEGLVVHFEMVGQE